MTGGEAGSGTGAGGAAPLIAVPLRDGSQLRVSAAGVQVGERTFELARIQDARQVSPQPETIAMRVAGAGLVEFQPAHEGDGAVALEALFRLRPDLRPAGFGPVQAPLGAGFPPPQGYPGYPPQPGMPYPPMYPPLPGQAPPAGAFPPPYGPYGPYGMPPGAGIGAPPAPGFPPPQGYQSYMPPPGFAPPGYMPVQDAQGRLTPFPRDFGGLLGAVFQLFGRHWRTWIVLGLITVFIPIALIGACEVVAEALAGENPFASSFSTLTLTSSTTTTTVPTSAALNGALLGAGVAVGTIILTILLSAWPIATLSVAARDLLLGRPVAIGRTLGEGLRRLPAVLGAQIIWALSTYLFLVPGIIFYVLGIVSFVEAGGATTGNTADSSQFATAALFILLAVLLIILGAIGTVFFGVRLGRAPYAAGAQRLGAGAALRQSWQLTRGNFWRVLGVLLIFDLMTGAFSAIASIASFASPGISLLIVLPLVSIFVYAFWAITNIVLIYDLRLRREGYAAIMSENAPQQAKPQAGAQAEEGPTTTAG